VASASRKIIRYASGHNGAAWNGAQRPPTAGDRAADLRLCVSSLVGSGRRTPPSPTIRFDDRRGLSFVWFENTERRQRAPDHHFQPGTGRPARGAVDYRRLGLVDHGGGPATPHSGVAVGGRGVGPPPARGRTGREPQHLKFVAARGAVAVVVELAGRRVRRRAWRSDAMSCTTNGWRHGVARRCARTSCNRRRPWTAFSWRCGPRSPMHRPP
jgi:hypothetical protein